MLSRPFLQRAVPALSSLISRRLSACIKVRRGTHLTRTLSGYILLALAAILPAYGQTDTISAAAIEPVASEPVASEDGGIESAIQWLERSAFGPSTASNATGCPDLTPLLADPSPHWIALEQYLGGLLPHCLRSADFFALYGAAQLHTGQLAEALESLERALLLQPEHGGAQIDYAQALFLQGQLFTALELNERTRGRTDLPPELGTMLDNRASQWRALTRQRSVNLDVLAGYDDNLNRAPTHDQVTLTLSGEPVVLPLDPDYRPAAGPYLNVHLGARFRQLAPYHQHNVLLEARGRVSEDTDSDLVQLDTRYAYVRPGRGHAWQGAVGMSHLFFGGRALYTATMAGGRYMPPGFDETCRPYATAVAQHQLFHNQSLLNAVESKLGAGLSCPLQTPFGRQQWVAELSALNNTSVRGGRPGGERQGWQASVEWSLELPRGMITTHLNHTRMVGSKGYSPVLADNARRWLRRSYLLMQYRQPLLASTTLMVNLFHQKQHSNLQLFRSDDTSVELGISYIF